MINEEIQHKGDLISRKALKKALNYKPLNMTMEEFIDNAPAVDTGDYARGFYDGIKHTESLYKRPQGDCKTCRHRDPEDKKCDCGEQERQGCKFPVSDDYYCKFYEKGGAE